VTIVTLRLWMFAPLLLVCMWDNELIRTTESAPTQRHLNLVGKSLDKQLLQIDSASSSIITGLQKTTWNTTSQPALSAGGDYADLYFEYLSSTSLMVDESMVKSASQGISAGCGVRVVSGERTGYAYTDDLSASRILHAARTAALIASAPAKNSRRGIPADRGSQFVSRDSALGSMPKSPPRSNS